MHSCVTGGHLKEFTDGESNFTALLQRAMEMEGVDRETLHQLVFLLMKVSILQLLLGHRCGLLLPTE